ncbi:hypothetical protein K2173_014770 [Erythroxylum novogranatense]|uniref:rhamnogalacturonan endolyase n=1 Tax=Erythroxylum novogranatense TaxID=1862640 RepID=A0AAV8TI71_9ROSI|nr:hypothetical protein K2173_014770 [Erythroxylum novogranatense]
MQVAGNGCMLLLFLAFPDREQVLWLLLSNQTVQLLCCREVSWNNSFSPLRVRLQLKQNHRQIAIDNGVVQVTFSKPAGDIIGIQYHGIDNVLEIQNANRNRGYWDVVWNKPGYRISYDRLKATNFSVIMEDDNQVEVSFIRPWIASNSTVPLNIDKRYILKRGCPGVYMYAILERLKGWPDVDIDQIRIVLKLQNDKFHFMAISDDRQRMMPTPMDRRNGRRLAYPEAVLLTNTTIPEFRGEVDDKYQYSCENKDNKVHGWISSTDPPVGFWMITPSHEFLAGGPLKQDLTSHVGPTVLSMFTSTHYTGKDMNTRYRNGEPWKKVLGPVFVYLNSVPSKENHRIRLWRDAKLQMLKEVKAWPYNFPQSKDFPLANQRGTVMGQLLVRDRYINERLIRARYAYVGLAAPGDVGSWQTDAKGYQFWTRANEDGYFLIENVRCEVYSLYAWVPGVIGDYKLKFNVTIQAGFKMKLGVLVFKPPRNGPTIWEIGVSDRTAAEFFVPDADPTLLNKLFINKPTNKFRQYGLWDQYSKLYPTHDLVYIVGISNYRQDWFFAHVLRKLADKRYVPTTWKIMFQLESVKRTGNYTLQLALASAAASELQVRVNRRRDNPPHFSTGLIGRDNAIARHGVHGLYRLYSIQFPHYLFERGNNTIYLTQSRTGGRVGDPFRGVLYDYIRLESPPDDIM